MILINEKTGVIKIYDETIQWITEDGTRLDPTFKVVNIDIQDCYIYWDKKENEIQE